MPSPLGNFFIRTLVNSPLHPLLGSSFAVITVKGRKTGRPISTPINVSREEDSYFVVSLRDRTWWRNLRGDAPASLRVGGRTLAVHGEIIDHPGEVLEELRRYFKRYPAYARYFDLHLTPEGELPQDKLQQVAAERLVIHLRLRRNDHGVDRR